MKSVVLGQYVPGDGFFYRVDPRTKIVAIFFMMISTFLFQNIYQIFGAFLFTLSLVILSNISLIKVIKGLKPIMVLMLFTLVFQITSNKSGELIVSEVMQLSAFNIFLVVVLFVIWRFLAKFKRFTFLLFIGFILGSMMLLIHVRLGSDLFLTNWNLKIYEKGIEMSAFVVLRLFIIIILSTILTLTTKPTDLTQGLERLMRPLKVIGFKSDELALVISISLRYIPTIFDEANKIMQAQASRGADFSEGKLKDKLRQVISLLIPMFIIAFNRSEELSDAMGSRNFVPGRERTRIHILKFSYRDVIVSVVTVAFFTTAILFSVHVLG